MKQLYNGVDANLLRILLAASQFMKLRRGIHPHDESFFFPPDEIRTFLDALSPQEWELLRQVARVIRLPGEDTIN